MSEVAAKTHTPVSADEYSAVAQFLHREARLLDEGRYEEWLEVLDETIVYEMPLTLTRERVEQNRVHDSGTGYFSENLASLRMRVDRLRTDYAWAEDPPTRTRHMLSNLEVSACEEHDRFDVRCGFVVFASRGSHTDWEQFVGHRRDQLVRRGEEWRILRRTLFLDQAVLGANSISVFL